ncbi:MAG: polysaccharide biosynthesis C-terminal domain-containing protein, partial [Lachnospiraceae bacterium]|nr:polysaccharide biosynthesis C-terminal domain-containing protein [Lachnospiraceae bacterium]
MRKLILKLAVPTMISMLVTSFYNLVDTIFVGHLKDINATAAVTVAFALMNIIQAVGFYFGQGSGSFISRSLGKKNYDECKKMAATGFYGAIAAGILILILGMIFIDPIATFCGAKGEPAARAYAITYIRIILVGAPVMCGSFVLNNQLRFQGNAMFAMIGLASGAVLNVLLDALLVPRFKVAGAAAATVICQCVSFAILLICTRVFSDNVKYSIKDVSFKFYYFKEIFRGGFPSLCRQGVASLMN